MVRESGIARARHADRRPVRKLSRAVPVKHHVLCKASSVRVKHQGFDTLHEALMLYSNVTRHFFPEPLKDRVAAWLAKAVSLVPDIPIDALLVDY